MIVSNTNVDGLLTFGINHDVFRKLKNKGITSVRCFKTFSGSDVVYRYEFLKGGSELGSITVPATDSLAIKTACEKYAKTL